MRYGAVGYLNARPLVEGLLPLVLDTPSNLVRRFEAGEVDVALLPVAAAGDLPRVGSLGVTALGPVESVLLFLAKPVEDIRTLALDPASRTSRVLAQVILHTAYGLDPALTEPPADAELVIGDAALVRARGAEVRLDLAEEWHRFTGLPFVFAAWYGDAAAEAELEAAYARGRARIADYARAYDFGLPAERLEAYLTKSIRFRIGPAEEEGLARFLEEGRHLGLL